MRKLDKQEVVRLFLEKNYYVDGWNKALKDKEITNEEYDDLMATHPIRMDLSFPPEELVTSVIH